MFIDQCKYEERYEPDHVYIFTGNCFVTGDEYSITIQGKELYALRRGLKIQDALTSLNAGDREFALTGTSPKGWEELFGPPPGRME